MNSQRVLQKELADLSKEKWVNIELMNNSLFTWTVDLMVLNPDSLYYGGYFRAKMNFPEDYPYSPPKFAFTPSLLHPNIYPDGRLCISILHPPGDDEQSGELACERWTPAQRVETVLLSIISLLDDAEISSPANVDAAVLLRDNKEEYKRRVKADVEKSKENIPKGFVVPTDEVIRKEAEAAAAARACKDDDADFWAESDEDFDFGSDTDEDADEEMGKDAGVGEENDQERDSDDMEE